MGYPPIRVDLRLNEYYMAHIEDIEDIDLEMVWDAWPKQEWQGLEFCDFCLRSLDIRWGQAKKIQMIWSALGMIKYSDYCPIRETSIWKRTGLI